MCACLFTVGNHGYNNSLPSMHPVFVARGPSFRRDYTKSSMNSVDLYPLMCSILGLKPLPNNGSLSTVKELLVETSTPKPAVVPVPKEPSYAWAVGSMLGAAIVVGFLFIYVKQVTQRKIPPLHMSNSEITQPLL